MNDKIDSIVNDIYSKGYSVTGDLFSETEINELLSVFSYKENELKAAGIGKKENFITEKSIRNDRIVWLERSENKMADDVFFSKIDELIIHLNRRCFLGLNGSEFHFSKYKPGAYYKKHKDSFSNDDARKISAVLYLNHSWKEGDGGELNIYINEVVTIKPIAGTFVVFESHIEHEVMLSHTNRISLTGWIKNNRTVI